MAQTLRANYLPEVTEQLARLIPKPMWLHVSPAHSPKPGVNSSANTHVTVVMVSTGCQFGTRVIKPLAYLEG